MFFNEKLYCPVCKVYLGQRYKTDFYSGHCNECKTTFTWWPKLKRPKALLDKHAPKKCGCSRCKN